MKLSGCVRHFCHSRIFFAFQKAFVKARLRQVEEGNEEGVVDHDDNLIDSLIDDVHFADLVIEKDVA